MMKQKPKVDVIELTATFNETELDGKNKEK